MKKKVILILLVFMACSCRESYQISEKNLTDKAVKQFYTADLSPFLEKDNAGFTRNMSFLMAQPGYIIGARWVAPTRRIEVFLFESSDAAMKSVKKRNNISNEGFHAGKPNRKDVDKWWVSECPSPISINTTLVSIVKDNLVLELYDEINTYSEIEKDIWITALKYINLIENNVTQ